MKDSKKIKLVDKARTHIVSGDRDRANTPSRKPDGVCDVRHRDSSTGHTLNDSDSLSKKGEKISFDSAEDLSKEIAALRDRK